MRNIVVAPAAGGWTVDAKMNGLVWSFLDASAAERSALGLAKAIASSNGIAQVLVRDHAGLTIASTVVGPGPAGRLGVVHRPARP